MNSWVINTTVCFALDCFAKPTAERPVPVADEDGGPVQSRHSQSIRPHKARERTTP